MPRTGGTFINGARVAIAMPVVNVQLRTMEARRFQDPVAAQQIRIDHNSNLTLVVADGNERARIEFGYTTSYGALGVIKLDGALWFQDAKAGEYATAWASTRNLPPEVAQAVHSAIMATCVPQAVGLAKDLRLPPPIPIPQVQIQKPAQATAKPDGYNPEVG